MVWRNMGRLPKKDTLWCLAPDGSICQGHTPASPLRPVWLFTVSFWSKPPYCTSRELQALPQGERPETTTGMTGSGVEREQTGALLKRLEGQCGQGPPRGSVLPWWGVGSEDE